MQTNHYKFSEIAINFDKKRIPLSAMEREKRKGEYRYYGAQGIIDYIDDYIFDGKYLLIAEDGENLKSNKQNIAQIVNGKFWVNNHAHIIQTNDKCNIDYLNYYLNSTDISGYITGSAQPKLSQANLNNIDLVLPDIKIQEKITSILLTIDEKIAINNATNNNLEQQAQAIYKSWFVDFEPFGGVMPDNWQCIQLDEVADFIGGYSYKGNELQPSKYAMATIKNFERKGGFKLDGYKEIIPSDKCKIEQEAKLYDILVAHTDLTQNADVIGNAELLLCTDKYEKIVFSMDVVKVVPKNNMPHFILATMLKSKEFKSHCLGYVNGTTVLHLSKKALPDYIINIPNDLGILSELEQTLKNIYTLISNNLNENIKLIQLRDTLLPKLMSGEIDVSNVDISTDKLSFSCLNVLIEKTYIYKILNIINYNLLIYNKYLEFAHLLQQLILSFL